MKVIGTRPKPRYAHSMCFLKHKNLAFLYGGKNEEGFYLSSIYLFNFASLQWKTCSVHGDVLNARAHFVMESHFNDVVVYGGIDEGGFAPNTFGRLRMV